MSEHVYLHCETAGERLDVYIAGEREDLTRSFVQTLIRQGKVFVGGKACKANYRMRRGDVVEFDLEPAREIDLLPQDIPLDIVYQDGDLAVINKPQGMVVHPAPGNEDGTLVNALLFHLRDLAGIGGELRPGIVHRIDKDTSGLLVIAKNDSAHRALAEQIRTKTAGRIYLAIVHNCPREEEGTVDAPIGRHPVDRKRMAVVREGEGRGAVTHWKVLERYEGFGLLRCELETGRTHQIRVHMAKTGHPIAGDPLYGPAKAALGLSAQALHAWKLHIVHPRTGETMEFCAPPPESFLACVRTLRARAGVVGTVDFGVKGHVFL